MCILRVLAENEALQAALQEAERVQEKNDARSVYQGTGLGMAIVKAPVDQMGGTITITTWQICFNC